MTTNRMKPTTGADRATNAKIDQRVEAIVKLMRDGDARPAALCRFVAEKEQAGEEPWKLAPGRNPLSSRTIERYTALATEIIRVEIRKRERETLRLHAAEQKKKIQESYARMFNLRPPFQDGGTPQ